MRAEKRKKNAPKELNRLKKALSLDNKGEVVMSDIQEIATVVPAEKIKKQAEVEMVETEADGKTLNTTFSSFYFLHGDFTPVSVSRKELEVHSRIMQCSA